MIMMESFLKWYTQENVSLSALNFQEAKTNATIITAHRLALVLFTLT